MKTFNFTKMLCGCLCLASLSSCYSYKPYLDSSQTTSEILREKIIVGKKYEVVLTTGQSLGIKVDSLTEQHMIGRVFFRKKNFHAKNFRIPYNQIVSVKNQKVNPFLTILAIGVPVGVLALFISNLSFGSFSMSI